MVNRAICLVCIVRFGLHLSTYHLCQMGKIRWFCSQYDNDNLFPRCALHKPKLVQIDSSEEHFVECIICSCCWDRGCQYLIHWQDEGPEGDVWLSQCKIKD